LGDDLAALSGTVNLGGKRGIATITKEVAWRKTRFGWNFAVGHLPAEANETADALSRVHAPPGSDSKPFPQQLRSVTRREVPDIASLWIVPE